MHIRLWTRSSLPLLHLLNAVTAQDPLEDDAGLSSFVTRPDLRAPRLAVKVVNRTAVSPGYHFVAPYNTNNDWESHSTPLIEACQVGPHIYDNNGELIWSGACLFRNENGFDFKAIYHEGKICLSLDDVRGDPSLYGAGIILSDQYQVIKDVQMAAHTNQFDQHEFAVINDGKTALYIAPDLRDMDGESIGLDSTTRVKSTGFREVDISGKNPKTIFDWQGADHIPLDESTIAWPEEADPYGRGWDFLHMNSVDKFPNGDYLVSFRYTNSLMRLSPRTGDVLWRLGGKRSDFKTADWVFSRQHHGRVITSNETHTVISFFDNASSSQPSDKGATTAERSSALVALLSHDPNDKGSWTATPIRRFERPDWGYTRLRGSIQLLPDPGSPNLEHITRDEWPNSNVFVSWSDHGYATEFSPDGDIVMETRFVSRRFDTYRAFKMVGFVGRPAEPPVAKALVYGNVISGQGTGAGPFTVVYISWNGATEVRTWRVYGEIVKDASESATASAETSSSELASASPTSGSSGLFRFARKAASETESHPVKKEEDNTSRSARFAYLGTYHKTGFETAITVPGAVSYLWAEALDSEGKKIGQTSVIRGIVPGVSIASWEEDDSTNTTIGAAIGSSGASGLSLDFDADDDVNSLSTDLTVSLPSSPFYSTTENSPNEASAPIALAPLTFPSAFPHGWGYGDTESMANTGHEESKSWWESYAGHKYELTVSRNTAAAVVGAMLVMLLCLLAAIVWAGVQMLRLRKRRNGTAPLPLSLRRRALLEGLRDSHTLNASESFLGTTASPTATTASSSMAGAKQQPQQQQQQQQQQPWWHAGAFAWRSRRASSRSYEPVLDHDEEEIDMDTWDEVNVPFYQRQQHQHPRPSSPRRRNGSTSTQGGRQMAQYPRHPFPPQLQGHDLGAGGMRMVGHTYASIPAGASGSALGPLPLPLPLPLISQIDRARNGATRVGSEEQGREEQGQAAWVRRVDAGHERTTQQQQQQSGQLWEHKRHKPQPGRYKRGRSMTTGQAEGWVTHRKQQQQTASMNRSIAVSEAEEVDDPDEEWGTASKRTRGEGTADAGGHGGIGDDGEAEGEERERENAPLIARME